MKKNLVIRETKIVKCQISRVSILNNILLLFVKKKKRRKLLLLDLVKKKQKTKELKEAKHNNP